MFHKVIKKALLGFVLVAFFNAPSHADSPITTLYKFSLNGAKVTVVAIVKSGENAAYYLYEKATRMATVDHEVADYEADTGETTTFSIKAMADAAIDTASNILTYTLENGEQENLNMVQTGSQQLGDDTSLWSKSVLAVYNHAQALAPSDAP